LKDFKKSRRHAARVARIEFSFQSSPVFAFRVRTAVLSHKPAFWEFVVSPAKLRVLVVDWDQSVAKTLAMVLHSAGIEAVTAFSGEEALVHAVQSRFDLLLADVMMGPMNGVQTALAFLRVHPTARVLLFSGSDGALPILNEAALAGHNFPVLAKPIHPTELFSHLRGDGIWDPGSLAASD
jgi:CheY-like chemotaxis protein